MKSLDQKISKDSFSFNTPLFIHQTFIGQLLLSVSVLEKIIENPHPKRSQNLARNVDVYSF